MTLGSADSNVVIRYCLDGVDPDEHSSMYRFPFLVTRTSTIRARAFRAGAEPSAVGAATLTFDSTGVSTPPTIGSQGGRFATQQTIAITAVAGATIRYTLSGVDPAETDPAVPATGVIVDRAAILKARAWEPGLPRVRSAERTS